MQDLAIRGTSGSGQSLPNRSRFEGAFGVSFASVRLHSDRSAAQASRAMGAQAFTFGEHIGLASPAPSVGLLAHELSHVVQQRSGAGPEGGVGQVGDRFEAEAHLAASAVSRNQPTELAARYPGSARPETSVQRKSVQRYESGEHAILGVGPQYPFMDNLDSFELPNHAMAHPGELVALAGDLYVDLDHIGRLPKEETLALIGFVRLEALWYQARRMKGDSLPELSAPLAASGLAAPASADLETYRELGSLEREGVWDKRPTALPKTFRQWRHEIYTKFKPYFDIFNLMVYEDRKPEGNLLGIKATVGRRRFRGFNDPGFDMGRVAYARQERPDQATHDPAQFLGEFGDLAANNVTHFSPENWRAWKAHHEVAFRLYRSALLEKDEKTLIQGKRRALAEDMVGLHFLTDRFSAGHTFNKEALMRYATEMILSRQKQTPDSSNGQSRHKLLDSTLYKALKEAFADQSVRAKWLEGVTRALEEKIISPPEANILRTVPKWFFRNVLTSLSVAQQVVNVLMGMPWRDMNLQTDLSPEAQSFGQASKPSGSGQYQLGVGNLAALNVHDVLNAVGFKQAYTRNSPAPFEMRGDDHLTDETMARARAAVEASQRQIAEEAHGGKEQLDATDYDAMAAYIPYRGRINTEALRKFFSASGAFEGASYDQKLLNELLGFAGSTDIPLGIDTESGGGAGQDAISPQLRRLTELMMDLLFLAPKDTKGKPMDSSGTGLNVSMLKPFLMKRLYDMVGMSYIAAGAADLSKAALELYAPRDAKGAVLPRAAHDFTWFSDEVSFALNVTDCEPGEYEIGVSVWERNSEMDIFPSGLSVNKGAPIYPSGTGLLGAKPHLLNDYSPDQQIFPRSRTALPRPNKPLPALPEGQRTVRSPMPDVVRVQVRAAAGNRQIIRVPYLIPDAILAQTAAKKLYVRVYADRAGTMLIGRSQTRAGRAGD